MVSIITDGEARERKEAAASALPTSTTSVTTTTGSATTPVRKELKVAPRSVIPSYNLPAHARTVNGEAGRPVVYLDIEIDGRKAGRMTFMLFADIVPITRYNHSHGLFSFNRFSLLL